MVYPSAGIANSTGSAWDTSYSTTGTGTEVVLSIGPTMTGGVTVGSTSDTAAITFGQSTVSQTTNIQAGATASGSTKTINLGTGGLSGSTTTITIGGTAGTSNTTLNGTYYSPAPNANDLTAVASQVAHRGRLFANRAMPAAREPVGRGYPLQGHLAFKNIRKWCFGAGTTTTTLAASIGAFPITSAGTITIGTPSTTAPYTRSAVSTGTTSGTSAATRCPTANIGAVVAGSRWYYSAMFGVNTISASQASVTAFIGLVVNNTALSGINPTSAVSPARLGMGFAGTASDWVMNNASGTNVTSPALTSGSGRYAVNATTIEYQLDMWSDGTNYYWQAAAIASGGDPTLLDINTGTFNANVPSSGSLLYPQMMINNGTVSAAQIMDYMHVTLETDA
jgi:hypothetical protein